MLLWSENFEVGKVVVVFVAVDVVPEKDPPSSGIHAASPAPSGSLWSSTRSNSPRRALLSSTASRSILRSAARQYFFACFSSLLFHLSCLLSILFVLLSSSLTSSLHCLFPTVTGMLKVAKMLRMQRACALTFTVTTTLSFTFHVQVQCCRLIAHCGGLATPV